MQRRALLGSAAVGLNATLAGCVGELFGSPVQETRSREFDLPDGARFRTAIDNGDVAVSTHGGDAVLVDAVVSARSEARLDDVTVEGVHEDDFIVDVRVDGGNSEVSVDLDVRVPPGTEVAVARSWNGEVSVRGVAAALGVGSVNGDVTVRNAGPVSRVETTNGEVDVDVPAPLPGDVTVRSENGDVDASLSPDVDAVLDASTENGDVEVDALDLGNATVSRTLATGTLGDGTREMTVATTNGDVTVQPLE